MEKIRQIIQQAVSQLYEIDTDPVLERPDPAFGDLATNVAMQIVRQVGQDPRRIAEAIVAKVSGSKAITMATVAGPGFINIRLSSQAILDLLDVEPTQFRHGQTVVIETNNPNPFKSMHIGHAYNAIIADTMANLLTVSGAATKRVSYHGDVGAHVGKSMWALLRFIDGDVAKLNEIPEAERNNFMSKMYAEGALAYKDDPAAKTEIDKLAAQSFILDDTLYEAVYKTVFNWSFDQIEVNVRRLGNQPIVKRYLESKADPVGVATVLQHVPDVFTESNKAIIFEGSKHGSFDNVFVAANGRGLYAARDLGLIQLKMTDFPDASQCIVVTGNEQAAYFRGVIAATELVMPELKGKLVNVPTGLVKLSTGKMSSRTGDVVTIEWLFDEFKSAIEARGGEATDEIIAGALRYQFLKVKIGGDVVFDINEAVSLTGNTGSYLQYAHARARSILDKVAKVGVLTEIQDQDRTLVVKLTEYVDVVESAMKSLEPHLICNYLFELAQEFNRYYENNQVVGSDDEAHRAAVVAHYADTLAAGLGILGIVAPNRL